MKSHDWIIGVLADLEEYAEANGLSETCEATPLLRTIVEKEIRAIRHALRATQHVKPQRPLQVIQGGVSRLD